MCPQIVWQCRACLNDHHAYVQAGKLELKKRLEGQLSKWGSLLQKFLRSTDDQVCSSAHKDRSQWNLVFICPEGRVAGAII